MVVDNSALLAVLKRELDAEPYETAILTAPRCCTSVANLLEAAMMVASRGEAVAGHELDEFFEFAEIEPTPLTAEHLAAARQAWRQV